MRGRQGRMARWWWLMVAVAVGACASEGGGSARSRVPVTEIKTVVGQWDGLLSGLSTRPSSDEDLVDVTIRDDSTYEAKAVRSVGVFQGRGTIELRDGALVFRGQTGATGTGQLFATDGSRLLEIEATTADGRRVTARLSPRR